MIGDTRIYKFLHGRDLPYVLENKTLKISSSAYFRREYAQMEVRDPAINDPHEGHIFRPQTRAIMGAPPTEEEAEMLRRSGLPIGPGTAVFARHNLHIDRVPDFHMLCFARGPLSDLIDTFCKASPDRPGAVVYDACLEIVDLQGLIEALGMSFRPGQPEYPLGGVMEGVLHDRVTYGDISFSWHETAPAPDPFRKHTSFEAQREYRLVFQPHPDPNRPRLKDTFVVEVPDLERFIRPVDINALLARSQ